MQTPPIDLALIVSLQAPYVPAPQRRSVEPNVLGEALWAWVCECVVPLLNTIERLEREGVHARLSLAISPLACEMLADIEAIPAYLKYLQRQFEAARAHAHLFAARGQEKYRDLAAFWEAWYETAERDFRERYAQDLLGALRDFQSRERIELLASPATLPPLPLLSSDACVRAQLALAVEAFKVHFGRPPRGLWTCHELQRPGTASDAGSSDSIARMIVGAGFEYVVEGAATLNPGAIGPDGGTRYQAGLHPWLRDVLPAMDGEGLPTEDFAPLLEGSLLRVRPHAAASEQAWHPSGYAGEERFLCSARRRQPGALRLWRNTGESTPLSALEAYEAVDTPPVCEAQAGHWLDRLGEWAAESGNRRQCVAFDASLLGARWFEGHAWLARTLRHAASDARFELRFASHALTLDSMAGASERATDLAAEPAAGAPAGQGATVWRNRRNEAMWAEVHECEAAMERCARDEGNTPNPKLREILNQCARELLLIQSGDWPLLLAALPAWPEREDDVRCRLAEHTEAFRCLISIAATVASGQFMTEGQRAFLDALRERDDVFASLSFAMWAGS